VQDILPTFITVTNPTGAEPVPDAALMNDTQNLQIKVEPGKTYFLRIINIGAFAGQYFWIEGHTFRIIEVDGVYHEPAKAYQIYIAAAQRYGILLTTKNETGVNYAINGAMDQDLFDHVPDTLNPNVTSFLVYDSTAKMPTAAFLDAYDTFDDFNLVPTDGLELFENPQQFIILAVAMINLGNGANYAFFNDITYVKPSVPSLYTTLSTEDLADNPSVYGSHTNTFVLGYQQVIEIVVNNHDGGKHPFHLHGHNFQAIVRGADDSGDYVPGNSTFPSVPMRRDTFMVRPNGHIVMRFQSDNPGVWLFHCHIEWHVDQGLIATIVEVRCILDSPYNTVCAMLTSLTQAPMALQASLTVPKDHYAACAAANPPVATAGNAAANTVALLDLTGQPSPPAPLPAGFTPRGIVALVFSCIAAVLGLVAIGWYGMGELSEAEKKREEAHVNERAARVHLVESSGTTATGSEATVRGMGGN
jgi:iron transport multicopper oxidase